MAKRKTIKNVSVRLSPPKTTIYSDPGLILGVIRPPWILKSNVPELSVKKLRQLLAGEKAKILGFLKENEPESLYALAKGLSRDFKAVRQDVKILEQFGFIELKPDQDKKTGKKRLKPILAVDKIKITIEA